MKMPDEYNKILKYYPGEQSLKVLKINKYQNNPEKSYTEKKEEHIPSGYSVLTCCSFDKSKK